MIDESVEGEKLWGFQFSQAFFGAVCVSNESRGDGGYSG